MAAPPSWTEHDTANFVWGSNWATPDRDQFQALLDNCDWTFCDGETVQFEAGCTLKGWKVCGKESGFTDNAIFLPLCGQRDQNRSARAQMGTRGLYWTNGTGTRYFLELFAGAKNLPYHDPDHGCSVRAICVGDDVIVPGQFELYQNNVNTVPDQFNAYYFAHGQSDYFGGKVLLENVDVNDGIWTDGHDLTINGGTVIRIEHKKSASTPGKLTIQDGCFGEIYRYVDKYGGADDGSVFILKGGKYKVRPGQRWCPDGYKVAANTGSDKEDYPYVVVEGDPSDDWFIGPATDLSAKATANTYIVSEPGTYKFKATVKGNGGLDPATGTQATAIQKSDIGGVTVLNNATVPFDVPTNGEITLPQGAKIRATLGSTSNDFTAISQTEVRVESDGTISIISTDSLSLVQGESVTIGNTVHFHIRKSLGAAREVHRAALAVCVVDEAIREIDKTYQGVHGNDQPQEPENRSGYHNANERKGKSTTDLWGSL